MVSDGAAALIIQDIDLALSAKRAIAFRARRHVNDILPLSKRERTEFEVLVKLGVMPCKMLK